MKKRLYRALRWTEKYTKTDMLYLTKGGFWITASKLLSFLAFFISSVAFANLLPQSTYGTFQYILSILGLLSIATLFGIETSLTRSVAKGNYADFDVALRTRIKWGTLGGLASLLVAGYYHLSDNTMLSVSFLLVACFVPFMDSFHIYTSILSGKKKFNLLARDEVATRMIVALLLTILVFFTDNILLVLFTFLFATTVLRFAFLRHVFKTEPRNDSSDPDLLSYGKHLTAIGIFSRVSTQFDKILIFHFYGPAILAAFFLSFMPLKAVQNIFSGLSVLAMPKFSNSSPELIRRTLPRKILHTYILIVPIVIAYELAAPFLYNLLYPLYPESILMSQLIFLQLLLFPFSLFSTAITAQKEHSKLYVNSSVYAGVRMILLLLLVPTYGTIGAIIAIVITSVISTTTLIYLFFKD